MNTKLHAVTDAEGRPIRVLGGHDPPDHGLILASGLRLITLSHGNNVIRLWGTNTQAVSYKLDLLTFKR